VKSSATPAPPCSGVSKLERTLAFRRMPSGCRQIATGADSDQQSPLVVVEVVRFQIDPADSVTEGALQLAPSGDPVQSMRKSTGDLVWDFIMLCNDRKAFQKIHEYEKFTDHCSDESVIAAICEYQLSLSPKEFMVAGFVGRVV
jgi:hypothetical protein